MLIMTDAMSDLAASVKLDTVTAADLPPHAAEILASGWVKEDNGAWVLAALQRSYSGERAGFDDLTGYEAAVNGRAVYDLDLPRDDDRAGLLLRRGYALIHEALEQIRSIPGSQVVTGLMTVSLSLTEDPMWVGNCTFWAEHEGEEPYFEIDDVCGADLLMSVTSQ